MATQSSDCIWPDFCAAASLRGFSLCHRTSTSVRGFLMQKSILVACYSCIKENCLYSWEYIFDKEWGEGEGYHEEELPAHTLCSLFFFGGGAIPRGQTKLLSPGSNRALPGLFMLLIMAREDSPRNSPLASGFPYLLSWIFESSFSSILLWLVDNIQFFNGT